MQANYSREREQVRQIPGNGNRGLSGSETMRRRFSTWRDARWFSDLSPKVRAEYHSLGTLAMLPVGGSLFTEGQPSWSVFLLCEGHIKLTKSSRQGKTLLVRIAGPGDILGLSAALANMPYEVSAEAMEPILVKRFERVDFVRLMQRNLDASLHATDSLRKEYRTVLSNACRMALSSSIAGKVAHLLLELATEQSAQGQDGCDLRLPLKHEDLAALLGTSRESVTRVLGDFKRSGLISVQGPSVKLLQRSALEDMV